MKANLGKKWHFYLVIPNFVSKQKNTRKNNLKRYRGEKCDKSYFFLANQWMLGDKDNISLTISILASGWKIFVLEKNSLLPPLTPSLTHTLKFESLAHYNLKKRVVKAIVNVAFFENIWLVVMKYVIKMSKLKAFSYNKQYVETIWCTADKLISRFFSAIPNKVWLFEDADVNKSKHFPMLSLCPKNCMRSFTRTLQTLAMYNGSCIIVGIIYSKPPWIFP